MVKSAWLKMTLFMGLQLIIPLFLSCILIHKVSVMPKSPKTILAMYNIFIWVEIFIIKYLVV